MSRTATACSSRNLGETIPAGGPKEHRVHPINGIDLDFQRFPVYFPLNEGPAHAPTMTAWMRQVQAMTREVARRRGRPLLVSARILARPAQNLSIGLDPVTWAKEKLGDFFTVSHYLRNDFPLPMAAYRKLLPDMPLYTSIEVEAKPDSYRRIARQLCKDGVDGIMVFNCATPRPSGKEPPFELLNELGDAKNTRPESR